MARPRDAAIDDAVLRVARRHLADRGYEGLSVAAVAAEAGTSRPAVYRRWPTKADLATAAIASMAEAPGEHDSGDPFADLLAELTDFQRGLGRPGGVELVGSMLQGSVDPELRRLYQRRIVAPRRRRLRAVLERGVAAGLLDPDADLELGVTLCTGSRYALALAGRPVPRDWAARTAALVWRALGG